MNMLKLNEQLGRHGLIYPDDPASYPCSLVGGRIGTSGWSLIGSRYGHTRDLVLSFVHVLPTGEVVRFGDGGGRRSPRARPATRSSRCSWATRARSAWRPRRRSSSTPSPEAEFSPFWSFEDYDTAYRARARHRPHRLRDVRRRGALRRAQGRLPAPRRRGLHPAARQRPRARLRRPLRQRGRGPRGRQAADADARGPPARATSATRSPRATGRRATTATRRRCTAARRPARSCR